MGLVVLFGIVNGLDRDFGYLDPASAFEEHLGLVFKPFALAVYHVLHEIKRETPESRLGIADLGSRDIRKDLYGKVVSETALPRDVLAVETADAQDELIGFFPEFVDDGGYASGSVLTVRIGSDAAQSIGHALCNI